MKVDLDESAWEFCVGKSTIGSNSKTKCGFLEKRVATTESLASKRKRRHFCRPVHFGSPKLVII